MEISEEFYAHVDKVAKSTSYKWTDLDWEDIRQDMWVHFLERPNEMDRILEDDPETRDKKLRRVATQVAVAEVHGYEQYSGKYIYGRDEVREMLEMGLAFLTNNVEVVVERSDLSLGMLELKERNPAYFKVIADKFFHHKTGLDSKTLFRALDKLTLLMNELHNRQEFNYEDGPGVRQCLSNSTSVAITGSWE